jgi:hypothetical protein
MEMKIEIRRSTAPDMDAEPPTANPDGTPEDLQADEARLAAWRRDEWYYIGVRAEATITIPSGINGGTWTQIVLHSPGLWRIESDSEESYLNEVYQDEVATLKTMIECMQKATPVYIVHDPAVETA